MSLGEILATWRDPAGPVGRLLSAGPREDRSLIILIAASVLMFVARTPDLARRRGNEPGRAVAGANGDHLFVMLFMIPVLGLRPGDDQPCCDEVLGAAGVGVGARVVLFWAMLAVVPGLLLHGLLSGIVGGETAGTRMLGLLVFAAFLWFWGRGLQLAYRKRERE